MEKISKPQKNRALEILSNAGLMTVDLLKQALQDLSNDPKVTQKMVNSISRYIKETYFGITKQSNTKWKGSKNFEVTGTKKQHTFATLLGNLENLQSNFEFDLTSFQETGKKLLDYVSDLVQAPRGAWLADLKRGASIGTPIADVDDEKGQQPDGDEDLVDQEPEGANYVVIGKKRFSISELSNSKYGSLRRGDSVKNIKEELSKRKIRYGPKTTRKKLLELLVKESAQQPGSYDSGSTVDPLSQEPGGIADPTEDVSQELSGDETDATQPYEIEEPDPLEGVEVFDYENLDFDNYFASEGGILNTLDKQFKSSLTKEGMMTDYDLQQSKIKYEEKYAEENAGEGEGSRTEESPPDDPDPDPDPDNQQRDIERDGERKERKTKRETDDDEDPDDDDETPDETPDEQGSGGDNKPFKSTPAGESLLRAMKRLPSEDVTPDDFETPEQSKEDHKVVMDIEDDLREGIWYDLDNKLDHENFHNERLRVDSNFLPTQMLQDLDSYQTKQAQLKAILESSRPVPSTQPTFTTNFTHTSSQPFVKQYYDQSDFGRSMFTEQRETGVFVF